MQHRPGLELQFSDYYGYDHYDPGYTDLMYEDEQDEGDIRNI